MKHNRSRVIWLTLSVVCVFLIWGNSLQPAAQSSHSSNWVTESLQKIAAVLFGNGKWITTHLVRKTAHFVEYALLGALFCKTWSVFIERKAHAVWASLLSAFLVASADETIQLFVEGRSGQISDVLLDFCGAFFGCLLAFFALCRCGKKERQ